MLIRWNTQSWIYQSRIYQFQTSKNLLDKNKRLCYHFVFFWYLKENLFWADLNKFRGKKIRIRIFKIGCCIWWNRYKIVYRLIGQLCRRLIESHFFFRFRFFFFSFFLQFCKNNLANIFEILKGDVHVANLK